jgi:hypothetical protein
MNNPLSLTDPSGFSWLSKLFKNRIFRVILSVAIAVFAPQFLIPILGKLGAAIVVGAIAGGVASGTLKGAALGALTAGLFYGAGGLNGFARVLGHAGAGCASAVAGGGKCGSGAISAAFGMIQLPSIKDGLLAAIQHGVMGGIGSTLGGGKFGDGFYTGVAGYTFNALLHEPYLIRVKGSSSDMSYDQLREEIQNSKMSLAEKNAAFSDLSNSLYATADSIGEMSDSAWDKTVGGGVNYKNRVLDALKVDAADANIRSLFNLIGAYAPFVSGAGTIKQSIGASVGVVISGYGLGSKIIDFGSKHSFETQICFASGCGN